MGARPRLGLRGRRSRTAYPAPQEGPDRAVRFPHGGEGIRLVAKAFPASSEGRGHDARASRGAAVRHSSSRRTSTSSRSTTTATSMRCSSAIWPTGSPMARGDFKELGRRRAHAAFGCRRHRSRRWKQRAIDVGSADGLPGYKTRRSIGGGRQSSACTRAAFRPGHPRAPSISEFAGSAVDLRSAATIHLLH